MLWDIKFCNQRYVQLVTHVAKAKAALIKQTHLNILYSGSHIKGPFNWHELTLIPAWISNHMPSKMLNAITYPYPNNGCNVNIWDLIGHVIPYFIMDAITYLYWKYSWTTFVEMAPWLFPMQAVCYSFVAAHFITWSHRIEYFYIRQNKTN